MGKDERFRSQTHISPGPGQYSPDVISSLSTVSHKTMNNKLNQTFHGGFTTSVSRGPDDSASLSKKASRKSMPGTNDNEGHLFGTHYNRMHYFPEIDKDFKNREGPGPAKYELFSRVVHSAGIQSSFPKVGQIMTYRGLVRSSSVLRRTNLPLIHTVMSDMRRGCFRIIRDLRAFILERQRRISI